MDLSWYNTLNKPFFNPPSWVFGPAWTILYILMAISFYLVWRKGIKIKKVKQAIIVFFIQLALNLAWSPIFFGAHNVLLALIVIIFMIFYIVKTIRLFSKIDKTAAYLLYPYIAWVSFATLLNFSVWLLNK
ncbi:MAG TPA: TspO/MBR family protein [Patescibacteria group bacterium]|nr:TspO/MBR family protein [Patescibacteria group bacterium]